MQTSEETDQEEHHTQQIETTGKYRHAESKASITGNYPSMCVLGKLKSLKTLTRCRCCSLAAIPPVVGWRGRIAAVGATRKGTRFTLSVVREATTRIVAPIFSRLIDVTARIVVGDVETHLLVIKLFKSLLFYLSEALTYYLVGWQRDLT